MVLHARGTELVYGGVGCYGKDRYSVAPYASPQNPVVWRRCICTRIGYGATGFACGTGLAYGGMRSAVLSQGMVLRGADPDVQDKTGWTAVMEVGPYPRPVPSECSTIP
eukprot:800329-Rhodomonas_salina.2